MGTQWIPVTRFEPKTWLLANGEVISEPALEQTSTGRKVRVVGTTSSVYANELDELLGRAAADVAAVKGTQVWLDVSVPVRTQVNNGVGFDPDATPCKLHLVHEPTNNSARTVAWWRFKDSNTPFEVLLTATMQTMPTGTQPGRQVLTVQAFIPARSFHDYRAYPNNVTVRDGRFSDLVGTLRGLDYQVAQMMTDKWTEFIRDNAPDWPVQHLGNFDHPHPRAAVGALLKAVQAFEGLDSIQVPDLSDPNDVRYRELPLYDTNVNSMFINDLAEYLDGAPTVEQAADLYQQMLTTLRTIGINVSGKSHNDFLAALLAGEKATMNMQVFALAEEGHRVDTDHHLSVHLPTGAFIVECTHAEVDKDVVAEKWEEAKMIASLTGTEDELLAYARQYAKANNSRRTSEILREHGA